MPMTNRSQALANNRKPEKFSDEEPEIIAALLPKTTPASSTGSSSNDSTNQLGKQRLHQLRTNAKQPAGFINKVPQQPKANKFGDDEQQQQQQQQRVAGIRDKLGADTGRSRQRSTDNDDGIDGDVFDDTAGNSRQHPRIKRVSSLPGSAARVRRVSSPTFVPTGEFANQHQSTANEYQGNSRGRSALAGNRRYQCASANSSPLRNRTSVSPNPVLYQQHASDTAYVPQYPTRPISPTILLRHDDVNR
ncbi:unnamed protein product [Notodromas monacha]|uniref:Uncharacterized protein n=1 Tax=Notodromas monacha TaxID=399045 RepID=A0A7R9GGK2_9CRUS|nr:unnamed protein product [Notodromas monacha]CAG0920289.1 unnamed protein product [Notodromas monacha]